MDTTESESSLLFLTNTLSFNQEAGLKEPEICHLRPVKFDRLKFDQSEAQLALVHLGLVAHSN